MTTTTSPNYIAVDPDGTFRPVPPTYEGIKAGLHDACFDVVATPDGTHSVYIDDEGMLNGSQLNIPASMFLGRGIYGPVVLTGGVDDEGDSMLPELHVANLLMTLARMWQGAVENLASNGQTLDIVAKPETIPPPTIVSLTEEQLDAYLDGKLDIASMRGGAK